MALVGTEKQHEIESLESITEEYLRKEIRQHKYANVVADRINVSHSVIIRLCKKFNIKLAGKRVNLLNKRFGKLIVNDSNIDTITKLLGRKTPLLKNEDFLKDFEHLLEKYK